MVAPAPTLDGWISFCEKLTPYQNFALIGLLFTLHGSPLTIFPTSEIVTEANARNAEKWSESRFRQVLLFYCDNYHRTSAEVAASVIDKADLVKGLVPLLISTFALPLGIAVAVLYGLMGKNLDEWCQKYSRRKFNGKGKYRGDFPEKEVDSFFDVTYLPEIVELVADPEAYPLEGYKINIRVKAETDGRIKVPTAQERNAIQFSFKYDRAHSFEFKDTQSNKRIEGVVDDVSWVGSDGPNVLRFTSSNMDLK